MAHQLVSGLKNLEYRGYDSCGVAVIDEMGIDVRKNIGTIEEVEIKERLSEPPGTVGIGHTRWATHGQVAKENSHPHTNAKKDFAVVHNGIISNYTELREGLEKEGYKFVSQTDTEVMAHLLEKNYSLTNSVEDAFLQTLHTLEGTYATAVISIYEPNKIFCAKMEGPLILGIGQRANYVGSDFSVFIEETKKAIVLEDGEFALVTRDSYTVKDIFTREIKEKSITEIEWDMEMSQKGGYPHYMLKEIHEQPNTVVNVLNIHEDEIERLAGAMAESSQTYFVGAGTTYYVSMAAQYFFTTLTGRYIPAICSDEFNNLATMDQNSLVVAVSQSGETYDTLNALKYTKEHGAKTAAIVNVMGSSMSRLVDHVIMQGSGPEICVLSTKAALAQMIILLRAAIALARMEKTISEKDEKSLKKDIGDLPPLLEKILNEKSGLINNLARKNSKHKNWIFLGRGVYYPIALEAALKYKEAAYLHAEGMPGGFLKHGTLALVDDDMHTLVFVPPKGDANYNPTMGSVEEVKARGGPLMAFHFDSIKQHKELFDESLLLPPSPHLTAPLTQLVVAQLFAYFAALALKRNVDKPRSLAKSVTVA
jgi:glucosamine--fructose-6-phosphate aminotransferase (isomerizing)